MDEFDEAINDRLLHVLFKTRYNDFLDYAYSTFDKSVMKYLNDHRTNLSANDELPELYIKPTPRKWEMMSDVMRHWQPESADPFCTITNLETIACGLVGADAGRSFAQWYYYGDSKAVGAEDIFNLKIDFPYQQLLAQKDYADRNFYSVMTTIKFWEDQTKDDFVGEEQEKDYRHLVDRLDQLVAAIPEESAYSLTLAMAKEGRETTMGYKAINDCDQAVGHMKRILRERDEYAAKLNGNGKA